jgi:hypothetical protein
MYNSIRPVHPDGRVVVPIPMRPSSRRSGFAWLVVLSLLAAAFVAPVIEVGDLLEATLVPQPARVHAPDTPARLEQRGIPGAMAPTREEFLVVGQYAAVGSQAMPGLVLEPLARLHAPRPAALSLSHAGRADLDRGPPALL